MHFSERYGPWAVVTGASAGIGGAMALDLARRGVHVVLAARRADRLSGLADLLHGRYGVSTRSLPLDLAAPGGAETLLDQTSDLDVGLVAACAGFGTSGPLIDADLSREYEMLAVNCGAVLHLSHAFAQRLAARGRGGLVLMSSLVAFQGVPRAAHYAATKAYVQALAEGLRLELAPHGVHVVASAPGPVVTEFGSIAKMHITSGDDAMAVAVETLDALGRTATVRPGGRSKVLGYSLSTLPRWLRVRVLARIMAGMTPAGLQARPANAIGSGE